MISQELAIKMLVAALNDEMPSSHLVGLGTMEKFLARPEVQQILSQMVGDWHTGDENARGGISL